MKIAVYQSYPDFGNIKRNVEKAIGQLSEAEADIAVLPELFNTGYQFLTKEETESLAEEIPGGYTCRAMSEFACLKNMFMVFGMAERTEDAIYNSAVVIGPSGYIGTYRKIHLFAEEKLFFQPGDTGLKVFDLGMARIGVMICFDWQFPEAARVLALKGAEIICHPSNLVLQFCQDAMVTRSLENGVFTATSNRIGEEKRGGKDSLIFTGKSQILNNKGEVLVRMGEDETGVSVAEINVKEAGNKLLTRQNDRFKDRRPEYYSSILDQ